MDLLIECLISLLMGLGNQIRGLRIRRNTHSLWNML